MERVLFTIWQMFGSFDNRHELASEKRADRVHFVDNLWLDHGGGEGVRP